jgi:hypothetical protein
MYLGWRLRRCGSRKRLLEHFFPFGLELLKFGVLCHCCFDPCLLDSRYGMSGLAAEAFVLLQDATGGGRKADAWRCLGLLVL